MYGTKSNISLLLFLPIINIQVVAVFTVISKRMKENSGVSVYV